jgi:hypothetical protein
MTVITTTWRSLVRRRLWPVALLLLAALVLVPMKLAKTPEPAAAAAAPVAGAQKAAAADAVSKPIVELATLTDPTARRRVLGAEKDPFAPRELPKVKKSKHKAKVAADATPTPTATPDSAGSGAGTETGGSTTPSTTTPVTPKKTYPANSLRVRFGTTADGSLPITKTLSRLEALPTSDSPVLVYLGLEDGNKTAIFMLSGEVTAQGDGKCDPNPENCQTLRLKVGQTEFLNVKGTGDATSTDPAASTDPTATADAQYELDLEAIHAKTTSSAKAAKAKAKEAAVGRKLVAKQARMNPLRYVFDPKTGTLHRLDAKTFETLQTQAHSASK